MCKMLIVDDDYASVKMMTWTMEAEGHEVRKALSGAKALDIVKHFIPDVVLCDIGMPGMDGYELCLALRQDKRLMNTLFIAQTGWGSKGQRQLSKLAGFHHHFMKPVDMKKLREVIAREVV